MKNRRFTLRKKTLQLFPGYGVRMWCFWCNTCNKGNFYWSFAEAINSQFIQLHNCKEN